MYKSCFFLNKKEYYLQTKVIEMKKFVAIDGVFLFIGFSLFNFNYRNI